MTLSEKNLVGWVATINCVISIEKKKDSGKKQKNSLNYDSVEKSRRVRCGIAGQAHGPLTTSLLFFPFFLRWQIFVGVGQMFLSYYSNKLDVYLYNFAPFFFVFFLRLYVHIYICSKELCSSPIAVYILHHLPAFGFSLLLLERVNKSVFFFLKKSDSPHTYFWKRPVWTI